MIARVIPTHGSGRHAAGVIEKETPDCLIINTPGIKLIFDRETTAFAGQRRPPGERSFKTGTAAAISACRREAGPLSKRDTFRGDIP